MLPWVKLHRMFARIVSGCAANDVSRRGRSLQNHHDLAHYSQKKSIVGKAVILIAA